MFTDMEHWADIRRRVLIEGTSKRQVLRETGMHWKTLKKILENSTPPGYRQSCTSVDHHGDTKFGELELGSGN